MILFTNILTDKSKDRDIRLNKSTKKRMKSKCMNRIVSGWACEKTNE